MFINGKLVISRSKDIASNTEHDCAPDVGLGIEKECPNLFCDWKEKGNFKKCQWCHMKLMPKSNLVQFKLTDFRERYHSSSMFTTSDKIKPLPTRSNIHRSEPRRK